MHLSAVGSQPASWHISNPQINAQEQHAALHHPISNLLQSVCIQALFHRLWVFPGYSPLQIFAFEIGESAPSGTPGLAGACEGQGAARGARSRAGQGGIGRGRGGAG